jgi:hypothetical protein
MARWTIVRGAAPRLKLHHYCLEKVNLQARLPSRAPLPLPPLNFATTRNEIGV